MADDQQATASTKAVGDRFPALKQLEEDVERAKLDQALAEARTKAVSAKLPSLDVEVAKDAVTAAEKTTGLARVLVQMCSSVLVDDVAGLALDNARKCTSPGADQKRRYKIRIVDDPDVFQDADVLLILRGQLNNLQARIAEYAPPEKDAGAVRDQVAIAALIGPIIGLGLQVFGLATKLFARDYRTSSAELTVGDLGDLGVDLLLARALVLQLNKDDEELEVEVDRVLPTPKATIFDDVWNLALSAEKQLSPVVVAAAGAHSEAQAVVDADETAITALDSQLTELVKRGPGTGDAGAYTKQLKELRDARSALADGLPQKRSDLAAAREHHHRGTQLLEDIQDYLTSALAPGEKGTRPPIIRAARVESLTPPKEDGQASFLLFARLIAGGVDHTIETKIGPDRWLALTGSAIEFALLAAGGELCTSGVRPVFQTANMKLDNPGDVDLERPGYVAIQRETVPK